MQNTSGFQPNVGTADRLIRVIAGLACLALWKYAPGIPLSWLLVPVGFILIGTGILSLCPIYAVLGIRTCPLKHD